MLRVVAFFGSSTAWGVGFGLPEGGAGGGAGKRPAADAVMPAEGVGHEGGTRESDE